MVAVGCRCHTRSRRVWLGLVSDVSRAGEGGERRRRGAAADLEFQPCLHHGCACVMSGRDEEVTEQTAWGRSRLSSASMSGRLGGVCQKEVKAGTHVAPL